MTVKLEIDTKELVNSVYEISQGLQELTKSSVLQQVSRAVFSLTSERFMIDVDNYARRNPKKMHHVYEWGKIGSPQGRLFVLERSAILGGSLLITSSFLPSKMPVPINPELLQPGKTGKIVTARNIFRNKAEVMENGTPVSFTAKRVLAFTGGSGLAFIAPGTKIDILHPGGIQTKNAFATYMLEWYTKNANLIVDASGYYDRLANDVTNVLNSKNPSILAIRTAVKNISDQIDVGATIK